MTKMLQEIAPVSSQKDTTGFLSEQPIGKKSHLSDQKDNNCNHHDQSQTKITLIKYEA